MRQLIFTCDQCDEPHEMRIMAHPVPEYQWEWMTNCLNDYGEMFILEHAVCGGLEVDLVTGKTL